MDRTNFTDIVYDLLKDDPDNNRANRIIDAGDEYAESMVPKWIPCSERLPEEGQEILATTVPNGWYDVVIIRSYYAMIHKSVIAWMPLPEPYMEGEQNGL